MRKLAVRNPEVAADCGGMRILFEAIIDPSFEDSFESITYSLLLLLNNPQTRSKLGKHLDFPQVFAVFTSSHQMQRKTGGGGKQQKNIKTRDIFKFNDRQLSQAKKIIIILLKSWKGLIYLANERFALKSLFHVLKQ